MEFKKGRSQIGNSSRWMHWVSRDGKYRVSKATALFGQTPGVTYHATLKDKDCWVSVVKYTNRRGHYISRLFRTRNAAEKACLQHRKEN